MNRLDGWLRSALTHLAEAGWWQRWAVLIIFAGSITAGLLNAERKSQVQLGPFTIVDFDRYWSEFERLSEADRETVVRYEIQRAAGWYGAPGSPRETCIMQWFEDANGTVRLAESNQLEGMKRLLATKASFAKLEQDPMQTVPIGPLVKEVVSEAFINDTFNCGGLSGTNPR